MRNVMMVLALVVCMAGCEKAEQPPAATTDGHQHTAPHGGVLAELGEHEAAAEMVLDRASGSLTLYVLDAHAENAVRSAHEQMVASAV